VEEALHNRRTAFGIGLGFVAVVVAVSLLTAPKPSEASRPTVLTVIFLAYALGSVLLWHSWFLKPENVTGLADRQEPKPSLGRMAWLLSLMGNAGMLVPVVLGVILYQISGEIWRLALVGGIGLAGAVLLYARVGQDLRLLVEHGIISWDPFGPHPG
jgi:hypothetical protein